MMMVTSAQRIGRYERLCLARETRPWPRSSRQAELGSRGSLRCWAADIRTGGMKSKSPCSRRNSGLIIAQSMEPKLQSKLNEVDKFSCIGAPTGHHVQEDRGESLGSGVRDVGYCFGTRCADGPRNRSHDGRR